MTPSRAALLLAAVLFLTSLGGHDFWAPDEPFFAEGAREMLVDGHWLVSYVNGVVNTHKPPLFFWLIALAAMPFGEVLPFAARLVSVVAALGTVALTMRICGRDASPRTAGLAGAVLATTYLFWEKARWLQTDSLLCCLIWIAMFSFTAYRGGEADGRSSGVLFWTATALAVLAKGPVGLLLPVGIVLATLAFDRRLGMLRRFAPLLGPALVALILGTWAVLATTRVEGYSVWGALQEHFISRGLHGMHHAQPWYYFATALPPNLLPWTGLLPGALVLGWRRRSSPVDRWLLVTVLFVLVFFSVSTEKRELYALPALPAVAMLIARFVGVVLGWEESNEVPDRRWLSIGQGAVGALFLLVGVVLPFAAGRVDEVSTPHGIALAVPLAVAGGVALWGALRDRGLVAVLAPMAGFSVVVLLVALLIYPAMNPGKSARDFAGILRDRTAASREAGRSVVAFDLGNLPTAFAFYADGLYTVETDDSKLLAEHLDREEQVFAVVNESRLDELPAALRERIRVLDRTVLSRREVALVSNRADSGGGRRD